MFGSWLLGFFSIALRLFGLLCLVFSFFVFVEVGVGGWIPFTLGVGSLAFGSYLSYLSHQSVRIRG